MTQAIKWSNFGRLVVKIDVRNCLHSFQGRRQCAALHYLEHWHESSQLLDVLPPDFRYSWKGVHKRALWEAPIGKNPSELDLATEVAMQSIFDVQSTFLDVPFNHCRISSPHCVGVPSRWNHNLRLTASLPRWNSFQKLTVRITSQLAMQETWWFQSRLDTKICEQHEDYRLLRLQPQREQSATTCSR